MNQNEKADSLKTSEAEEVERDLLELADISTDKQLEDIRAGKLNKENESRKQ